MPNATTIQWPPTWDPVDQQHRQVEGVERRRPPRIQLRLRLGDKAPTDRTLARTSRGHVGAQRLETPRILAGRHTNEHLVDDTSIQRVRIRERPHGGQRHLRAIAPGARAAHRDLPPAQDKNPAYPVAFEAVRHEGLVRPRSNLRQCKYLNNIIEQDHRFIKRRTRPMLGFKRFTTAWRTLRGIEIMHALRKGQARWMAKGDVVGQTQLIHKVFGLAA